MSACASAPESFVCHTLCNKAQPEFFRRNAGVIFLSCRRRRRCRHRHCRHRRRRRCRCDPRRSDAGFILPDRVM